MGLLRSDEQEHSVKLVYESHFLWYTNPIQF